jgi:hypothetical protein
VRDEQATLTKLTTTKDRQNEICFIEDSSWSIMLLAPKDCAIFGRLAAEKSLQVHSKYSQGLLQTHGKDVTILTCAASRIVAWGRKAGGLE